MILSDGTLRRNLDRFFVEALQEHVNPASVDIRIGRSILVEHPEGGFDRVDLTRYYEAGPLFIQPGEFALVETYETLVVPNGYAFEMKLKSSRAREGWNHSLAFWFDPGWHGVGTMEVTNLRRYAALPIYCGLRFAQVIVHRLDADAERPYSGRYQHSTTVEASKG